MEIIKINSTNVADVAKFMSTMKPEWWDVEGAQKQLESGIGWYGKDENNIVGWILCKPLPLYSTLEIECLGFNDHGTLTMGKQLQPLIEQAEAWAISNFLRTMRFTMTSRGFSCHDRDLGRLWEELRDLHAIDRTDYDFFTDLDYQPVGILPELYGSKYHGILLLKRLNKE